ncbi:MAG: PilZ domain-containing protein [Planctomycetota bacterium]
MLREDDGGDLIARLWPATELQAVLPQEPDEFFDLAGPMPAGYEDQRSFRRFYLRQRAIMHLGKSYYGIYVKDISRQGIGMLSPIQLLPLDRPTLILAGGKKVAYRIMRCRRFAKHCYEIGAELAASDVPQEVPEQISPTAHVIR